MGKKKGCQKAASTLLKSSRQKLNDFNVYVLKALCKERLQEELHCEVNIK